MSESNPHSEPEIPGTFTNRIGIFFFKLFEQLIKFVPLGCVCFAGQIAGRIAYYLIPSRRQIVARNLRIVINPELKGKELEKLVRQNIVLSIKNMLASTKTATMSDRALTKHTRLNGAEVFDDPSIKEHGLICIVAHSGNWELLSRSYTFFPTAKLYGSMYRRMENPLLEKYLYEKRTKNGAHMFSKENGIHAPLSFLKQGGGLGVLCDQFVQEGVFVPYFGKVTGTTYLPALMQRRTGASIKPCVVASKKNAFWECNSSDGMTRDEAPDNLAEATIAVNKLLEEQISKSPLDGFWMHHRWKVFTKFVPQDPKTHKILSKMDLKPFRILFFTNEQFEEAILTVPLVKALRACRCDMQVNIICPWEQAGFWQTIPEVSSVTIKGSIKELRASLNDPSMYNQGPYDLAFLFDDSAQTVKALKPFQPVTYSGLTSHPCAEKRRLFRMLVPAAQPGKPVHRIEDFLALLKEHEVPFDNPDFFPRKKQLLPEVKNKIALSPFSSLGKANEWDLSNWETLVNELQHKYQISIVAQKEDKDRASSLAQELQVDCQIGTPEELLTALTNVEALISVDGLLPSLAAHTGTPATTLFSTRTPERYRPMGTFHAQLHHHSPCSPCFLKQCDQKHPCINKITPEQVLHQCMDLMSQSGNTSEPEK